MLSIFGERERPNYSAIRLDSLCCTEGVSYWSCVHMTYLYTDVSIVFNMHEYVVITIRQAWSRAPGQTCFSLSVVSVARRPLLYFSASG